MIMRKAVFVAPSRSTSVCSGSDRCVFPAAVMMAFLISTSRVRFLKPSSSLAKSVEPVNRVKYGAA